MAHWKKSFPSKYLSAVDLDDPIIATIKSWANENVGVGEDVEQKPVIRFREADVKGVVLNQTRCEAIERIAGDPDMDKWVGVRIRISRGSTNYKGQRVACIVIDAPPKARNVPSAPAAPPSMTADEEAALLASSFDDDGLDQAQQSKVG